MKRFKFLLSMLLLTTVLIPAFQNFSSVEIQKDEAIGVDDSDEDPHFEVPMGLDSAGRRGWFRILSRYTGGDAVRPSAAPVGIEMSEPRDNSLPVNGKVFRAARDLVIDSVTFRQFDLPFANSGSLFGDFCLYARTPSVDPGPSEIHCTPIYLQTPRSGPSVRGMNPNGIMRRISFPDGTGLFMPAGSQISCPNLLGKGSGSVFTPAERYEAQSWCTFRYHVPADTEVVGRIARIPFLDAVLPPGSGGNVINNQIAWLKGWKEPVSAPLKIRGFSVYLAQLGLNNGVPRTYHNVCLIKRNVLTGQQILQQECIPSVTLNPVGPVPNPAIYPGFFKLAQPIVLNDNDRLYASCQTGENITSDCALYVFYEVSKAKRVPSIASMHWDIGHINQNTLKPGVSYCTASNVNVVSPAGMSALNFLIESNPVWDSSLTGKPPCRESNRASCYDACYVLYKPFPKAQ